MTRLLLVEDDPTSQSFLHAAAQALPAHVDVAGTVADARVLAASGAHDAWLVDAHLPDGTGAGLLAALRADGLQAPALAHTAAREQAALDALRAAGFALALSKPVSAADWQAAIRRVLGSPTAEVRIVSDPRPSQTSVWNREAALSAVGGDAGNADALLALFLCELPGARDGIVRAAGAGDHTAMRHALHRLRASCGFVGAERLGAAAALLHGAPGASDRLQTFVAAAEATLIRA